MNIAIFDLKPWEKKMFSSALKGHKVTYFKSDLDNTKLSEFKSAEIISCFITSQINQKTIKALPKLKLIATRSTGYDHIDAKASQKKKVAIANVPSYGENTVAEHAFALILSLSRNIHKSYLRTIREDYSIEGLQGFDLADKTIGVVGAGRIGRHTIRIANGFGMKVIAYDPHPDHNLAETLDFKYVTLNRLLKESDIVTLHVPYCPETHHLINKKNIKLIKKGSLFINTARGGLVDTNALIWALDKKVLAGAGLDVLEEEELILEERHLVNRRITSPEMMSMVKNHILLSYENVVFTPHIAFYSIEAVQRITKTTIDNILAFINNKPQNLIATKKK
jgi:D-lactate dehydrogenase